MEEVTPTPISLITRAEEILRVRFGHDRFRPGQRAIVRAMLAGEDVLAVQPTGSGKSICFQVPALMLPGPTLVVSPLISLMEDQVGGLRLRGVPAAALTHLTDRGDLRRLDDLLGRGALRLLYVSPERLERPEFQRVARRAAVVRIVVDEAHCVSEWGHDFRPAYRRIGAFAARLGRPPIAAFTATATDRTRSDIERSLGLSSVRRFVSSVDRPNLRLEAAHEDGFGPALTRAGEEIRAALRGGGSAAALVYALTRDRCVRTAEALRRWGIAAAPYHAGMPGQVRQRIQAGFLAGDLRVVCATSAFGMGIDHPSIRVVCHLGRPPSLESYVQEAGRAGRDGRPGRCLLLGLPDDRELHRRFVRGQWPAWRTVARAWAALPARRSEPEERVHARLRRRLDPETATAVVRVLVELGCVHRLGGRGRTWRPTMRTGPHLLRTSPPGPSLAACLARGRRHGALRSDAIGRYLRSRACRRAAIATYFGESPPACGRCDRCGDAAGQR